LYQAQSGTTTTGNDPTLRPENALSSDLTAEGAFAGGILRTTYFYERVKDALYSQPLTSTTSTIQNIDLIRTQGVEAAWQGENVGIKGLDFASNVTYADSRIMKNSRNSNTVGRKQIRVPDWRANLSTTWHQDEKLSYSMGMRYSGRQYGTIDNSDNYQDTYFGNTRLFMVDVKVLYKITSKLKASLGVDNLNNNKAWSFHPYSQRTYFLNLKADI
jgi:iron complex outermembrane receptor protein